MFAQNFLSAQGSSCSNDGSMRKKARIEARLDAESCPVAHELRNQAGQKLRMFLLDRFCMGTLPGSDVAELCYLITQSGGIGVADLALRPDQAVAHGHRHVRLHAGKVFPEPDATFVRVPLYEKRESRRTAEMIPVMLPSTLLNKFVNKPEVLQKSSANFERLLRGLPCYEQNPIVQRARGCGVEDLLRPIALYWDGVQYSVHDTFTGFYVTDILSGQKFLSFLLRAGLTCMFAVTILRASLLR